METFSEQLKKLTPIASELSQKTGVIFHPIDIYRAAYGFDDLSKSALNLSISLRYFRNVIIGRDGSKTYPFRFRDIARRQLR